MPNHWNSRDKNCELQESVNQQKVECSNNDEGYGKVFLTCCSVHLHNGVAKKRAASTSLLQRHRAHMVVRSVDFIGGDFNMSAFSTVGDVITDPEFAAPGSSLLWGLGGLDDTWRECAGFIIMLRHPRTWRVQSHGCYKFDNADVGLEPRDLTARYGE